MSVAISWANKMQLAKCDIMVGFPISSHNYSFRKFFLNPPIILKIIPTFSQLFPQKVAFFSKTHANILIKHI